MLISYIGHPICSICLKDWMAEQIADDFDDLVSCAVCRNKEASEVLMRRPGLKHETSKKRSKASWLW